MLRRTHAVCQRGGFARGRARGREGGHGRGRGRGDGRDVGPHENRGRGRGRGRGSDSRGGRGGDNQHSNTRNTRHNKNFNVSESKWATALQSLTKTLEAGSVEISREFADQCTTTATRGFVPDFVAVEALLELSKKNLLSPIIPVENNQGDENSIQQQQQQEEVNRALISTLERVKWVPGDGYKVDQAIKTATDAFNLAIKHDYHAQEFSRPVREVEHLQQTRYSNAHQKQTGLVFKEAAPDDKQHPSTSAGRLSVALLRSPVMSNSSLWQKALNMTHTQPVIKRANAAFARGELPSPPSESLVTMHVRALEVIRQESLLLQLATQSGFTSSSTQLRCKHPQNISSPVFFGGGASNNGRGMFPVCPHSEISVDGGDWKQFLIETIHLFTASYQKLAFSTEVRQTAAAAHYGGVPFALPTIAREVYDVLNAVTIILDVNKCVSSGSPVIPQSLAERAAEVALKLCNTLFTGFYKMSSVVIEDTKQIESMANDLKSQELKSGRATTRVETEMIEQYKASSQRLREKSSKLQKELESSSQFTTGCCFKALSIASQSGVAARQPNVVDSFVNVMMDAKWAHRKREERNARKGRENDDGGEEQEKAPEKEDQASNGDLPASLEMVSFFPPGSPCYDRLQRFLNGLDVANEKKARFMMLIVSENKSKAQTLGNMPLSSTPTKWTSFSTEPRATPFALGNIINTENYKFQNTMSRSRIIERRFLTSVSSPENVAAFFECLEDDLTAQEFNAAGESADGFSRPTSRQRNQPSTSRSLLPPRAKMQHLKRLLTNDEVEKKIPFDAALLEIETPYTNSNSNNEEKDKDQYLAPSWSHLYIPQTLRTTMKNSVLSIAVPIEVSTRGGAEVVDVMSGSDRSTMRTTLKAFGFTHAI